MPKVFSNRFRGKVVNLPHTEHGGPVQFDGTGFADVTEVEKEQLLYFFPDLVQPAAVPPAK